MEEFGQIPDGGPEILNELVLLMKEHDQPRNEGDKTRIDTQLVQLIFEIRYIRLCDILWGLYGSEFTLLQAIA
ncbi:hypothetical protein CQ018_06580 [Arthrobacter sp. MYb227]|uniref:hypothetical protein n=1 Tax=Arthrobacter sp. MYb227 TaxID=1848601 RepID=UPI000CFB4268|nr:hypothetical protein [Arthrobacter sp. MYb227]PQZ94996.1 hypothetical protein CQ018_06580 [Arthrobacter sp. MYb227]